MNIDQVRKYSSRIKQIARKHGIVKVYVFGSVARGVSTSTSDVDFLLEMEEGASLFGCSGFGYECEKLLGIQIDVIPSSVLSQVDDQEFVKNVRHDAVLI